jgi:GTP-binding protein
MSKTKVPIVAIVGRANVGKSSIFNVVLGRQEAITAREPGTTRDSITARASFDGKDFWLVDTAGMKQAEDDFELSIQEQIIEATDAADIILVVIEAHVGITEEDRRVATLALKSKKPVILVVNKADQQPGAKITDYQRLGIKHIYLTNVPQKQGLEELFEKVAESIPQATITEADDRIYVALIGRPNVGKSSLFNAIAKKQQALVADRAGTTRDVNRTIVRYEGREIELMDTAGIRKSGKVEVGIEKFSVLRALQAIEQADVCLFLMDANELNTQLDQKIAGLIKEAGKGIIIVVSKWDSIGSQPDRTEEYLALNKLLELEKAQAEVTGKKRLSKTEKIKRAKALAAGEVNVEEKDPYTRDSIAPKIMYHFQFIPFAPLIFTSATTSQNVSKLYDIILNIKKARERKIKTSELNDWLGTCVDKHPPAGLKNRQPKLNYITQTDDETPTFKIFGSHTPYLHWSYKRYLEKDIREVYGFAGTPIRFTFSEKHVAHKHGQLDGKDPKGFDWKRGLRPEQIPNRKAKYAKANASKKKRESAKAQEE